MFRRGASGKIEQARADAVQLRDIERRGDTGKIAAVIDIELMPAIAGEADMLELHIRTRIGPI